MKWRFLVADDLHEEGRCILRREGEILASRDLREVAQADALIVRGRSKVTRAVLSQGQPKLHVVARAGTGMDNIDLHAARDLDVIVLNAPEATTDAVAEHTFALILALARDLPHAAESLRSGRWEKERFQGRSLAGKTLGLIGMGRIGSAVSQRALAFGMKVLGNDPSRSSEQISACGALPVPLPELFAHADFVSLHMPLNEQSRGLIDVQALDSMRVDACLINTARGPIVDEDALLHALNQGRLAGAALDVFSDEPTGDTALTSHPRVICTPHIGGQTLEAQAQVATDIATEVLAALRGEPLRWRIA